MPRSLPGLEGWKSILKIYFNLYIERGVAQIEILPKLTRESAREYVIRILKQNIVNNVLEPGQMISEKEIAEELNVSRTPVREALIRLAQEQLVEIFPQKGTIISLIDLDLVEEARFLRYTLETAVIRLACQIDLGPYLMELEENLTMQGFCLKTQNYTKLLTLDNLFHRLIFTACKKEWTYSLIEVMNVHFNRVRMLRLTSSIDLEQVIEEHRQLFIAIRAKDGDKGEAIMKAHLTSVIIQQKILKAQYPKYFKN